MAKLSMRQDLRLRQEMVLTPQLILTQKLLQLTRMELNQELSQELQTNPYLELLEDREEEKEEYETESSNVDEELVDWKRFYDGVEMSNSQIESSDSHERPTEPIIESTKTLWENLHEQLQLAQLSPKEFIIGEYIVGNLDEKGFLAVSVDDVAEKLNKESYDGQIFKRDEVKEVLGIVQAFEPAGIAARDLQESFLIQLDSIGVSPDSLPYRLVKNHFSMITRKNFIQLSKLLRTTPERIEEAMHVLSKLSFAPALDEEAKGVKIEPDLVVRKVNGEWEIIYNYSNLPALRISKEYLDLLGKHSKLNEETREFLKNKLNSAKMWINSIEQRQNTLLSTMEAILNKQKNFFEKGQGNLKPLKMEEVANIIDMDTSTVSRVVRGKYVQTPFGVYSMKSFFVGGLQTESGEDLSKNKVQNLILSLVENEDKNSPYSDQEIAEILNEREGIKIARRTVSKYRDILSIPSGRMRKR